MNKKGNKNLGKIYQRKESFSKEDSFHLHRCNMRTKLSELIREARQVEINKAMLYGLEVSLRLISMPEANTIEYLEKIGRDIQEELSFLWS